MGVLDTLKELGAEVEFFSIKTMEYMIPAYYIIASAEASSNLERFRWSEVRFPCKKSTRGFMTCTKRQEPKALAKR